MIFKHYKFGMKKKILKIRFEIVLIFIFVLISFFFAWIVFSLVFVVEEEERSAEENYGGRNGQD